MRGPERELRPRAGGPPDELRRPRDDPVESQGRGELDALRGLEPGDQGLQGRSRRVGRGRGELCSLPPQPCCFFLLSSVSVVAAAVVVFFSSSSEERVSRKELVADPVELLLVFFSSSVSRRRCCCCCFCCLAGAPEGGGLDCRRAPSRRRSEQQAGVEPVDQKDLPPSFGLCPFFGRMAAPGDQRRGARVPVSGSGVGRVGAERQRVERQAKDGERPAAVVVGGAVEESRVVVVELPAAGCRPPSAASPLRGSGWS